MGFQGARDGDGVASKSGGHAVVLGASLAGLLAARVLADQVELVTVVERDAYPSDTSLRKGVPQASHVHALMRRGDLNIIGFTRPLLDLHVRRRLWPNPRVRILEETETLRLLPYDEGGVSGVLCRARRTGRMEAGLHAALVVDATGRG